MARQWLVSGVVQGVGFRYFVHRRALGLALSGWVRNLPDGRVEVVAQGPPGDLASLEVAIARGPPHSHVNNVDKSDISDEVTLPKAFEIR